ncbi:stealth conserved region 3 domain-containing protein [Nocardioides sp.]|uniref:stealth conserved region 3 domain-containing protein n=1 Tax=Nocardioides sp. TaxID=35761 RepID=UPI0031FF269A|nr:glycosyl transferase, group 1 [Nocardioides sp.]
MRIAYLVFNLDGMGGTSRSAITQANALAADHDVRLVSITRSAEAPHYAIDDRIDVSYLVDVREDVGPLPVQSDLATPKVAAALFERESSLIPARWDGQFSALTDVAMEAALPHLDVDLVVTVTPALLASAIELLPDPIVVVHQEHRSSSDRKSGLEPLLTYAPRADVVALLTPSVADWLRAQLGEVAPEIVVMPNPLPIGFAPRSRLDNPLIVAAGRLVPEKQFGKLVQAFEQIADQIPEWRLRIYGEGPQRQEVLREARKSNLWDRVEVAGSTTDMPGAWAAASISALTSRAEGFPLVVQEAMAAGVPVVSFDCASGPREIIEHEVNGLLVGPESIAGMATALLRLATDDDLRRRLGEGAVRSSRQYDAHALAERWLGIFADARARRVGRGRVTARATATTPRPRPDAAPADISGITPVQARQAALSWVVDSARRVTDEWLVVPAHEGPSHVVIVPMKARAAFLTELGRDGCPPYLALRDPARHGWHERRGPIPELAADLRRGMTSLIAIEPWPEIDGSPSLLGQGCTVDVEFWEETVAGDLASPRPNPYAQRIPRGADTVDIDLDGVTVPTLPLMALPTVNECRFPVDVVYTWVDGNDPEWDLGRERRLASMTGTAQTKESSGQARFVSRDELRYSMRSLHLFAPWVRRIHLVTAGQVPDWLDTSHPAVTVVDHSEILPADALPTYNSHAIETALHRIPDLSEHFVYFNDDFMLGRPVRPEAFFSPAGLFATFFSANAIGLSELPGAPAYLKAAWNNRNLLEATFGAVTTNTLAHAPYPHRRSVLDELSRRFPDEVAATARAPFRSETDLSMLSSFAQHYALMTGTSYVGEADLAFVNLSNSDVDWQLQRLLAREQDFICLGDHHDHALRTERLDQVLANFFEAYFPQPAPWERGS